MSTKEIRIGGDGDYIKWVFIREDGSTSISQRQISTKEYKDVVSLTKIETINLRNALQKLR